MSVLSEYPDAIRHKKDLQVWNNAVFDGDSEGLSSNNLMKSSPWSPVKKPLSVNQSSDSIDSSFSTKENRSPSGVSGVLVRPVHRSKPLKSLRTPGACEKTDEEIEIEKEIERLYARLESIRAERNAKNVEKPRKTEHVKNQDSRVKKIEEFGFSKAKIQRRGFSLGPNEIMSANSNLNSNSKAKQSGVTPNQAQNRRKSCFWKLEDITEEKGVSRGKNPRAATSIGAKKGTKKDDSILASVQPKKLFGEQSVPAKKPLKPGRVIPSRYNQATVNSSMRKKSLTDTAKPHGVTWVGTEGRVKKKWDVPSEIVIPKRLVLDEDEDENENENENENGFLGSADVVMPEVLPRIRVVRYADETPRDSGPAKRVAELVGKKSYFGCVTVNEEDEETVCQKLSFDFEEDFEC